MMDQEDLEMVLKEGGTVHLMDLTKNISFPALVVRDIRTIPNGFYYIGQKGIKMP